MNTKSWWQCQLCMFLISFKECLGIQRGNILPHLGHLQVLVYDFVMLQALEFQSSCSEQRGTSWCQWKYSFDPSCHFTASWRAFFFLFIQVPQHRGVWSFEQSGLLPAEKTTQAWKFRLKQMSVQGKPSFQLLPEEMVSSCCLSKTAKRSSDHRYIYFLWKTFFRPRHLFMPDTINNFQNFRKLLKSSRSAKKLSLGMFYCLLRSGWPCTYCKW